MDKCNTSIVKGAPVVAVQRMVMPPLVIPLGGDKWAVLPLGISLDDFKRLQKTLKLWKKKMVLPDENQEQ